MTSPDQRAKDGDRNDAIKIVEAALASGRIVQADRDKRVDELRQAHTMQDIDMVVRDLRQVGHTQHVAPGAAAATAAAMSVPAQQAGQTWPQVNYGPAAGVSTTTVDLSKVGSAGKKIGCAVGVVVLLAFLIPIVGVVIALFAASDSFPDTNFAEPTDETTYLPGQEPQPGGVNVHTVDGFEDLLAAMEEETGSTETFMATLYPRYGVVQVPIEGGGGDRYQYFYWDGEELGSQDNRGTTTYEEFELSLVDPEVMIDLLERARTGLDEPTSWYVSISGPPGTEPQLSAYASNEFGETAYYVATLDGEVVYESLP